MTQDDKTVEITARALLAHRDDASPIAVPWAHQVSDIAVGYAVQLCAERIRLTERSDQPVGWKIGATGAPARAMLGVSSPFYGRLFATMCSPSPAELPAAGLWQVHEPEIGLVIGRDLGPAGAPYTAADIAAATRAVVPAIEVVGTWFSPWSKAGAANLAADNGAFGHWVHGAEVTDFAGLDLMEAPITLSINGAIAATGKGANVDGGAFEVTAWLANALVAQGRMLKAGDFITTGTTTPPQKVEPGQVVVADFGKLGAVSLTVGA